MCNYRSTMLLYHYTCEVRCPKQFTKTAASKPLILWQIQNTATKHTVQKSPHIFDTFSNLKNKVPIYTEHLFFYTISSASVQTGSCSKLVIF